MKTSARGIALIKEFEGFKGKAYLDPVGIPTIGYGFTKDVSMGDTITQTEAVHRLARELYDYERGVFDACLVPPNQNQLDALVCFAFNVGVAAMKRSSAIKAHNRGDTQAAARSFGLWNKAGGKVWPGLTRRRSAEAALYLTPALEELPLQAALPMPQKVDGETPLTSSPINKASVIAGASAAIASASEIVGAVNNFKRGFADLSDWAVPVLLAATVAAAGFVIWQRWMQRRGGWA